MPPTINIAAEDALGIATLQRIIGSQFTNVDVAQVLPKRHLSGKQPLRQRVPNFRAAAQAGQYFVVLTDLDDNECPLDLLDQWGVLPMPPKLLFRIAVREVEAWLLGDRANLALLLGIKPALVSSYPRQLDDPKAELLKLAAKGNAAIRRQLLPTRGAFGKVGPAYNDVLCGFINNKWDYRQASRNIPSLQRFLDRLPQFIAA